MTEGRSDELVVDVQVVVVGGILDSEDAAEGEGEVDKES